MRVIGMLTTNPNFLSVGFQILSQSPEPPISTCRSFVCFTALKEHSLHFAVVESKRMARNLLLFYDGLAEHEGKSEGGKSYKLAASNSHFLRQEFDDGVILLGATKRISQ